MVLKMGLVLAGGGCKAAYQIGVWKALIKLNIDKYIQGVSGTSSGALNAALFAIGDYESAERIWLGITKEKMLPIDNVEMFSKIVKLFLGNKNINLIKKFLPKLFEQGNVSRQGLLDIMNNEMDLYKVYSCGKSIYATCTELPEINCKYFKLNEYDVETVEKILCASSALPPVYGSEEIGMMKYVDGALTNSIPIQPLIDEGFDTIFIVQFNRDYIIERSKFPNVKIINIIPSSDQGGVFSGMLDFSTDSISKRIKIGYEDTINLLEPIFAVERYRMKKIPMKIISKMGIDIAKKSKGIADNFTRRPKENEHIDDITLK